MNLILWLLVGTGVGWLTTHILHRQGIKDLLVNIILGIIGAVVIGYLVTPMIYKGVINRTTFNILALILSLAGAVILLTVVHFFHRKPTMTDVEIQAQWTHVRSKIQVRWNKLTDEDVEQINGNHDRLINLLQERYGCNDEKAEDDLQSYLRAVV